MEGRKKEKKSIWDSLLGGRSREKTIEEDTSSIEFNEDLPRMIGYIIATALEDQSLVLKVCESASANEANAKAACTALRRDIKYGDPNIQLSAARLWANMMQNRSEIFLLQLSSRKFVDALEGVIKSPDTSPVVRERLMEVLAGAAFIYSVQLVGKDGAGDNFLELWRRLKPYDQPDYGVPFDTDDPMFSPMIIQPRVHDSQDMPENRSRVMTVEEEILYFLKVCKIARGNAGLLSEALASTNPSDFGHKKAIRELYTECGISQELIYTKIPSASVAAEHSRTKLIDAGKEAQTSVEEDLLVDLLTANEALFEALRTYEEYELIAAERMAQERGVQDKDGNKEVDNHGPSELTRMIGYLTATASEDYSLVVEVCERASANEANAKEASRALRREFKYAEPPAQLSAARLWAFMLRNASGVFLVQNSSRKFIDVLEEVLTSSRTSPVVRERLMEVLAAAVSIYLSRPYPGGTEQGKGFRSLWCKLKPVDKPDDGIPFDSEHVWFNPPVHRPSVWSSIDMPAVPNQSYPQDQLSPLPTSVERTPANVHESPLPRLHRPVISPEEDIRRLFQECTIAQGNAGLLSGALTSANPGDIEKEAIREFYAKCRASQELIYSQIPWATSGAERSRAERGNSEKAGPASESTIEEKLLVALVNANDALHEALRKHDDHKRTVVERIVPAIVLPTPSPQEQHQPRVDQPLRMPTPPPVIADESSTELERLSPAPDANGAEGRTGRIRRTSLMWLERHRMTLYRNIIESDSFEGPEWVREASTDYIYDMKIYQSLTVYTFLHLTHCVKDPSLLSAFHTHIQAWKEWDVMQSLKHHQIIRDHLHALLVKSSEKLPLCLSHIADEVDGSQLPELDVQAIACYLAANLDDSDRSVRTFRDIFALRGDEAQSMVNLLHTLVEDPAVDSTQKTLFADALVRLSKRSCCYPESLVLKDIEIDSTHPVITGAYSEVWKGYTQGQPVGVKKVRMMRSDLEDILKACAREAIIWSRLSHPNLLPFYGIFYLDDEHSRISLISPWMEHGHIGEYLERFPGTDRELLALDIGLGVEYLHTSIPAVIHGDLKPRNIFVTPSGTACLADFGLAYAKDPQRQTASSTQGPTHGGTLAYEAPELFDGEPVSFSADMYAFGCVLYEMFAGVRPFHDLRDGAVIKAVAQGKRPGRPAGVKDWVWRLIESCWRQEPSERPHPGDIVRELRSFTTGRGQHRHHNWDDSFGAHIRSRYSLVDHPTAFPLHTHSRT